MIRSLCNFGKVFATRNAHYLKCSPSISGLNIGSSNQRLIHTNAILHQNASSQAGSATTSFTEDIPVVSISGVPNNHGSKKPYSAVYWGKNDSMNTFKQRATSNAFLATLEACTLALNQAIHHRQLDKIIIKTDSEYLVNVVNEFLETWRQNDFTKKNGSSVKHKDEIKKLDDLLSMINVKFELIPSSANNYVLDMLKDDPKHAETIAKLLNSVQTYDPAKDGSKNVIFVCSASFKNGQQVDASYSVHFKGNEELNFSSNFNKYPISHPRALMFGIIQALNVAKEKGLKDIVVVTNNIIFLRSYESNWKTSDGVLVKNNVYYKKIKALADGLNVSFRFISSQDDDSNFKNALSLAYESLTNKSKFRSDLHPYSLRFT